MATLIPLVVRVADDLSNWLSPAFGGAVVSPDFDGVEALAEDRAALWSRGGFPQRRGEAGDVGNRATMKRSLRSSLYALTAAVRLATLEIKLDLLVRALERRYRPDQPRAPKGTPEGGQWIDDLFSASQQALAATERIREAAGPKCDGFSGGCQSGGTFGTTGMFKILGRNLCKDCAVKFFSIEDLSGAEQLDYLGRLDKTYGRGGK